MKYRADVDGLRALAVVPVLFFHASVPGFTGGFVGVDVFFVISGFVITARLREDLDNGRFSIISFYERRIRRIFPALFAMIFLTSVVAAFLFLPENFEDFSKSVVATSLFVSNIYFWKFSGYFDTSAHIRPLLHTWSLAVEEQYYIFMPIAMYIVHRFGKAQWLLIFVPAAILSLALSVYATDTAPTANFFLLPTRAWELLLGALLALTPALFLPKRWLAEVAAVFGLVMILFAVFSYSDETAFPGFNAIAPCLGAAILIQIGAGHQTFVGRALSLRPMVAVGLVSYSLYLVHWPIVVFMRYATMRDPTVPEIFLIIVLSFLLAYFSWRYVERPFRVPGAFRSNRVLFGSAGLAMAAAIVIGFVGIQSHGLGQRFPEFTPSPSADADHVAWKEGSCFLDENQTWRDWKADQCHIVSGHSENALLFGDSFAAHYVPGIEVNASSFETNLIQYTMAGCPPILSYYSIARPHCQDFATHAVDIIKQYDIKVVVLAARWMAVRTRGLSGLEDTLSTLRGLGVKVYLIGQTPEYGANVDIVDYRSHQYRNQTGTWYSVASPDINEQLKIMANKGTTFIDPTGYLCKAGRCLYKENGDFIIRDSQHFTAYGAPKVVQLYFPLLQRKSDTVSINGQQ